MRRSGGEGNNLYPTDKYSLYSSDTEERIVSVDKGLERCANMLKMLDEDSKEGVQNMGLQQDGGKKPVDSKEKPTPEIREGKMLSDKLSKKGLKEEKQRLPRNLNPKGGGVSAAVQSKSSEPEKCMRYHQHHQIRPAASSTPTKPETKARTQVRVRNMKDKRACLTPPPPSIPRAVGKERLLHHAGSAEDLPQQVNRKRQKVHRRLLTEPGKVPPAFRNGGNLGGQFPPPPALSWVDLRATAERNNLKRQANGGSPPSHLPPPPPPLFHPYCHMYGFPYFPFPYYPPPPDWPLEPGEHGEQAYLPYSNCKTDTEALDLAQHVPFQYSRPFPLDYYHSYYRDIAKYQKKSQDQAKPHPPSTLGRPDSAPCDPPQRTEKASPKRPLIDVKFSDKPPRERAEVEATQQNVLDLESLDDQLCEVLRSCEDRVHHLRAECRSLLVGVQMEEVQQSLRQCRQLLHQQCSRLAFEEKQKQSSAPSWLSQIQQLEDERAGLIERIKESCTAYSEVRREMNALEKLKDEQGMELEATRLEVSELQAELNTVTTHFGETVSNLKMTKEELINIQQFSETAGLELKTKNAALQQHIHSLFEEVAILKEEKLVLTTQLTQVVETSKEEEQMLKVSLSEKDTQLLHTADQLLGLRQCLAQFVSELAALDPLVQYGVGGGGSGGGALYCVSTGAVNRLKYLAEDGNIDRFLASAGDVHTYEDPVAHSPISSTASTVTGDEDTHPSPPPPHLASTQLSSQVQVITPLYSLSSSDSLGVGPPRISSPHVADRFGGGRLQYKVDNNSHKTGSSQGEEREAKFGSPNFHPLTSQQGYAVPNNYHHYQLKSSPSHSSVDARSTVTTSSEIDFRNNLASLDADIARLQMQFKVARQ